MHSKLTSGPAFQIIGLKKKKNISSARFDLLSYYNNDSRRYMAMLYSSCDSHTTLHEEITGVSYVRDTQCLS